MPILMKFKNQITILSSIILGIIGHYYGSLLSYKKDKVKSIMSTLLVFWCLLSSGKSEIGITFAPNFYEFINKLIINDKYNKIGKEFYGLRRRWQ